MMVSFYAVLFPTRCLATLLYTTLPHNLIKDKLVDLMERIFQREGSLYIACNDRNAFFTSDAVRNYNLWSCQKVCEALTFLLDNVYIRFRSKLYRQIVGIPMGTNCAPLVAGLFLFCYERVILLLAVPRRLFCFGSLVVLDMVCRFLSLFLLYINIKIGKNSC